MRAIVVGAGLMGRWHADAIVKSGGRLAAIVDRASDRAQRLARAHPGARVFVTMESALGAIEADVAHICTPLETHVPMTETAIRSSLHALVEKPLATSAPETERLFGRAAQSGVLVCPVHQFLFQEGVRRACRWLGSIGDLAHIETTFCSAGGEGRPGDRLDEIAAEILPHPLALLRLFAPALLAHDVWDARRPAPGELRVNAEAGGTTASIFVSLRARPTVCAMSLLGNAGAIHLDLFHGYAVLERGSTSRARKILHPFDLSARRLFAASANMARRMLRWEPAYPGLRTLVREMHVSVRAGGAPPIPPADTIAVARARDAIIAGAHSHRQSEPSIDDRRDHAAR